MIALVDSEAVLARLQDPQLHSLLTNQRKASVSLVLNGISSVPVGDLSALRQRLDERRQSGRNRFLQRCMQPCCLAHALSTGHWWMALNLRTTDLCSQDVYPSKPIRIVVPYPARGDTDLIARRVEDRLPKVFRQGIVIDNKCGAGGVIRVWEVARARSDGYTVSSLSTAIQYVQSHKTVPLAVVGKQRAVALPQVPTLGELSYNELIYETYIWIGLQAPAKTPPAVIARLAKETRAIVSSPDVAQALQGRGLVVINSTPAQLASVYSIDFNAITRRIRALKIAGDEQDLR